MRQTEEPSVTFPDWAIGSFTKYEGNPILEPSETGWDSSHAFNPAVIVKNDRFYMLYRGIEDCQQGARGMEGGQTGLAWSDDGIHFHKYENNPVIPSIENERGPHDPRMWKYNDTYYLTYNAWCPQVRQCLATSKDLLHWERHGPRGEKNDSIVTNPHNEAVKINGKFMLYNDQRVGYSDDLIHWDYKEVPISSNIPNFREVCMVVTNILPEHKKDIILFASVWPKGNLLKTINEKALATGRYTETEVKHAKYQTAICEVLISKENPEKVLEVTEPVLYPTDLWEFEGLLGPGKYCLVVFLDSGLIMYKDKWWLYYGGGDHVVCLATAPVRRNYRRE